MKHKSTFQVVLRYSADERTCAIVRCRKTDAVYDGNSLYDALCKALTAWSRHSEEGRAAYRASAKDHNVGDLAGKFATRSLRPYLKAEGVHDLPIETYSGATTGWGCNDHLFNGSKRQVEPPSTASAPMTFQPTRTHRWPSQSGGSEEDHDRSTTP